MAMKGCPPMRVTIKTMTAKFQPNAGIALGPILFIIAILAILAAAIAAGSGSFNASTNTEGNKTKASAIIQIGDNLKVGMDRLTMENSIAFNTWTISPANTSTSIDLFSPLGGGINPPSTSMAANPTSDAWLYPQGGMPGLGTYSVDAANTIQLAMLNVTQGVCQEINNRIVGVNNVPAGADLGNFLEPYNTSAAAVTMSAAWPTASGSNIVNLSGKPIGCLHNTNTASAGYFFYEVLFVQ
jgi:hypothetical protein